MKVFIPFLILGFGTHTWAQSGKDFLRDSLIGEWGIYGTITGKESDTTFYNSDSSVVTKKKTYPAMSMCNACPTVTFQNDFTALIKYPNGDKENCKWSLNFDKLIISDIPTNDVFSETEYQLISNQKEKYLELELLQKENGYSIILRK
jgi:hypothetical protein